MTQVNLSELTTEQRQALMKELEQEQLADKQRIESEREQYKELVHNAVARNFKMLQSLSNSIQHVKRAVFADFDTIIAMKEELYKVKEGQRSHTFSSENGNISIKLGYRVRDHYDDTVNVGVAKVKEYLATLAKDDESAELVGALNDMLKPNKDGNLKPSRVLELRKWANKKQDPVFLDGVHIIENSYKPAMSCQFIEVRHKDEKGREHSLPLSISAFDIEINETEAAEQATA